MQIRKFPLPAVLAAAMLGLAACATTQPATLADSGATASAPCTTTGTRIRAKDGDCTPKGYPFRSYSAEELESTGHVDLLEALRHIDPAFQ